MKHPARQVALTLMSLVLTHLSNSASAQSPDTAPRQDWLQFRGPGHDGKSAAEGLLQQWPEGGPKLLWSAQGIGKGFSQVTAAGELLYVSGLVDKQGVIHAYSRDGKLRWEATYGPEWVKNYPGAQRTDGP